MTRELASAALDRTDVRISLARELVGESPTATARFELEEAEDGQGEARKSFTAGEYGPAWTGTIRARDHADRAVAVLRNLPEPDRVQAQVERSRDMVDRAREKLAGCDNPRARTLLGLAQAVQERAETAVDDSRYLAALQLTLNARERVSRAMRLCGVEESPADEAARALQRTDEVLASALRNLSPSTPGELRDELAQARSLQSQAQSEARHKRWEPALRLTLDARSLAQRALRSLRAGPAATRR